MEGENSTSGPQPYQPNEAEVTNSPISNITYATPPTEQASWGFVISSTHTLYIITHHPFPSLPFPSLPLVHQSPSRLEPHHHSKDYHHVSPNPSQQ